MTVSESLVSAYRGIVCDLDGVIYRGPSMVPGADEAMAALPVPVVYATNNASRPPAEVAEHLNRLGVHTTTEAVVNSSMAGADHLAGLLEPGARVLAIGGDGVVEALTRAGLTPVRDARDGVVAVLQGYGPQVSALDLAEAAYAVATQAHWVATNTDLTLPTERGIAPGNGSLVGCVQIATGRTPTVVGKPEAPLYLMSCRALGLEPPAVLGVGDRLETDIAGASAAGMDSALVLTGVHGARDAALADGPLRPTFIIGTLAELCHPYAAPQPVVDGFRCGSTTALVRGDELTFASEGVVAIEAIRAGLATIWAARDAGATPARVSTLLAALPDRV